MTARHAAAVVLWVLAWTCAGFTVVSLFAAGKGDMRVARRELAVGLLGAGALAGAGWVVW